MPNSKEYGHDNDTRITCALLRPRFAAWILANRRLGAMGLALPELFRARAQAAGRAPVRSTGRAKSCILLFMGGGPPQMDTFDLKPDAPEGVRGIFPPIATSV